MPSAHSAHRSPRLSSAHPSSLINANPSSSSPHTSQFTQGCIFAAQPCASVPPVRSRPDRPCSFPSNGSYLQIWLPSGAVRVCPNRLQPKHFLVILYNCLSIGTPESGPTRFVRCPNGAEELNTRASIDAAAVSPIRVYPLVAAASLPPHPPPRHPAPLSPPSRPPLKS
jgi:hypothetical protein